MSLAFGAGVSKPPEDEWQLTWQTATPERLDDLEEVVDEEGVKMVADMVNEYFENGFDTGKYKFWYFHSDEDRFIKVIVAEERPDYDMILMGADPALGMAMFRRERSDYADVWRDLAVQVEKKGMQGANSSSKFYLS